MFVVDPGPAARLIHTGDTALIAGSPSGVSVRVVNPFGNTVSGYRGTVSFSSDDATARLPARYTFTTADAGAHTFSVIFGTLGAHTLTASDQQASGLSGSLDVVVARTAALGLNVTGLTATTAGVPQAVTVSAVGPGGETAAGYASRIHFTSTDPQADLPADYSFVLSDGGRKDFWWVDFWDGR